MTATTRWEPCATILLQAALGPCSRGCSQGDPWAPIPAPHSQDTPWELHVREPVQWVLGTQRQPVLGHCLRGWGQMSSRPPWAELGSFLIPLGCTGILSYTSRISWDPSSSL